MKVGVIFPQYEIEPDAGAIKDYTQAVEAMGFRHIMAIDHVLGANKASRPDWPGTYHLDTIFHEPFTLFGFMGIYSVLLMLGLFLIWREIEHGPGSEPAAH